MIPYGRQDIRQEDIDAVVEVLQSDFLTQGPKNPEFEHRLTDFVGAAHGIAVNSATSALHIACLALDLGPGDMLWTSPITFVASANCALYCGADVDFVDIDPDTFNMCPVKLAEKLEEAAKSGTLPKIIIPVHMCGQSCDMAAIGALARQYGVAVIEDASHAIGGKYQGRPIGDCAHSDITVFSFHPVKIITSAEGGMAVTQDALLAEKMALLRSHGITRDPDRMTKAPDGPWYYEQIDLGFNYRMTELQAVLGLSQMSRLEEYVRQRNLLAEYYDQELRDLPLKTPVRLKDCYSSFHLYIIQLDDADRHVTVFEGLKARNIGVNLHYIPVHLQPYYRNLGFAEGQFPIAENYYSRAISIPLYPTIEPADRDIVIQAIKDCTAK
ncbi:UDP-4-amino-4,6-dideoxy-N-acetyl-beta-L-altrosamine transaminase [Parasphingorhabdus sp.]|uniref:UDP-4-amino-4, 6-dideoxy-N-acetyl-beta-L-altrosamine transaminase n=1 Tax=Parasphingorhabdus sp. TaxID=2709688 RepID=UPI003A930DF0